MRSDPPAGGPLQCAVNRGRTSLSGTRPPARLLGAKTGPAPDTDQAARPAFGPDRLPAASTGWGGIAKETATLRLPGHDEDQTRARAHARRALVRGCPGVQVEPRSAGRTVRPLTPVTRKQRPFGSANGPRGLQIKSAEGLRCPISDALSATSSSTGKGQSRSKSVPAVSVKESASRWRPSSAPCFRGCQERAKRRVNRSPARSPSTPSEAAIRRALRATRRRHTKPTIPHNRPQGKAPP
jgi:hypothetical protein